MYGISAERQPFSECAEAWQPCVRMRGKHDREELLPHEILLRADEARRVIEHFVTTGGPSPACEWISADSVQRVDAPRERYAERIELDAAAMRRLARILDVTCQCPPERSGAEVIAHLKTHKGWPRKTLRPRFGSEEDARLEVEFHEYFGVVLHYTDRSDPAGFAAKAADPQYPLIAGTPIVTIRIHGAFCEKWPFEMFLGESEAERLIDDFLAGGRRPTACEWVGWNDVPRVFEHPESRKRALSGGGSRCSVPGS